MLVHLIDGTYELFRHFYGMPKSQNAGGHEVAAVRGVLGSLFYLIENYATHVAIATDHVIESFRNELYPGYKDGSGIDPLLLSQFQLLEESLAAGGFTVWPMVEFEADDALAAGARMASADDRVERVFVCTPDKDLAQCVVGDRVVQFDRRQRIVRDEDGVIEKFGVPPASIPDWLALVGDSADGFPGVPRFGAKTAAAVLARYGRIEDIPLDGEEWDVDVRGAAGLAAGLAEHMEDALLYRRLATLDRSAPVSASVDELEWTGPRDDFRLVADVLETPDLLRRAEEASAV
ncbi:MAG: 5'-3' exonuclease H3TH domain-containing protein [Gemmatimonadota bacterium]|nr:5'-3' exonuclease H3TH domain-containing protein [Gemmatimonadota bacterium]